MGLLYFENIYFNDLSSTLKMQIHSGTTQNYLHISAKDPFNFDADPDPDSGSALEKNGSRLFHRNFKFFVLFFSLIFMLTWWGMQKSGNFYNLSFFSSSDLGFESKFFLLQCFGWYFAPWIRIRGSAYYCGSVSGSRKLKSCRSNRSGS